MYIPKKGERVRVTEVDPHDNHPKVRVGDVVTVFAVSDHGRTNEWLTLEHEGLNWASGTWCRVEPAPAPVQTTSARDAHDWADAFCRPRDSATRKGQPIATGVLAYFPKAMAAISEHSKRGNDKHNPGDPLGWQREKSTDEADSAVRHIVDALAEGPLALDADGGPHLVGAAWRVLAWLERALEGDERWRTVAPAPKAVP